ncbi:MAG: hypothetical protein J6W37_09075 [Bacteroidales bacterium]|nr:hypothetical protein [Bacteroidales bacterium]
MKKISIFLLVAIIGLAMISCKKNDSIEEGSHYSVVKLNNSKYSDWLFFGYNSEKGKVTAYVDSSDAGSQVFNFKLTSLNNDYFLVNTQRFNTTAYSDISVSEYKEIWKATEGKDICDTLTSRIIDREPFAEIYEIMTDYGDSIKIDRLYEDIKDYNYKKILFPEKLTEDDKMVFIETCDEILKMIENNKGVKRIK